MSRKNWKCSRKNLQPGCDGLRCYCEGIWLQKTMVVIFATFKINRL